MRRVTDCLRILPCTLIVSMLLSAAAYGQSGSAFKALEDGARFSPTTRARVGFWGGAGSDVAADGSFRLPGAPVGAPVRVATRGSVSRAGRLDVGSESEVLAGFDLLGPTPGRGPFFALDAVGPSASRTVTLAVGGEASVMLRAETRDGIVVAETSEILEAEAIAFSSSDPGVVTVDPAGTMVAHRPGFAWLRMTGAGEAVRLLVHVDGERDTDRDGAPDAWEIDNGFDPLNPTDVRRDTDRDGVLSVDEVALGTDPREADTDGDGLEDGEEAPLGADPLNPDTDGDGRSDGVEVAAGSDPVNPNDNLAAWTPSLLANRALSAPGVRIAASADDTVFVVGEDGALRSFRIDAAIPAVLFLDSLNLVGDGLEDVAAHAGRVYVAAGDAGVHVIDATRPGALSLVTTVETSASARGVVVDRQGVYVATDGGLEVFTVDAGALATRGTLSIPPAERLAVSGSLVFLGLPSSGDLLVADVRDPDDPLEIERAALPISATPFVGLAATGRTVYVAHGAAGLLAVHAAADGSLAVIDSAQADFGGAGFGAVALVGNRLLAHTAAAPAEVQLFELADDGSFAAVGDVTANAGGARQLVTAQNLVVALDEVSFSVSEALPSGDRAGLAPSGRLSVEAPQPSYAPGETFHAAARAWDDLYIERVEFLLDGRVHLSDSVPPFRGAFRLDQVSAPASVHLAARAVDLAGNETALNDLFLVIERDLDGDGTVDSRDDDRDGDGIPDLEELFPGADGYVSDPEAVDGDGDGLDDFEEVTPGVDGLLTDPGRADSDADGLLDGYEVDVLGTDPTLPDTDGNGVDDGAEDGDGDGLPESLESLLGADPFVADSDADGLDDGLEVSLGLDPTAADTDGDGLPDGAEDADGDGLSNADERLVGADLSSPDTDGDGLGDGDELRSGTNIVRATDFSSRALSFTDTTVRLYGPLSVASLELVGSVLTVAESEVGVSRPLVLSANRLTVDEESRIDVSGLGHAGARTAGNESALGLGPMGSPGGGPLSGGTHGGSGAAPIGALNPVGLVQPTFGSVLHPDAAGGGGSAQARSGRGGSGGGVISLVVDRLVLDGEIRADGAAGAGGGGGAGGSIRLECRSLSGRGTIRANGGDSAAVGALRPGGGGGGRIALICSEENRLGDSRVTALAGAFGNAGTGSETAAAGTIVLETRGVRELRVDGGGLRAETAWTELPDPLSGTIAALGPQMLTRLEGPISRSGIGLGLDPDRDDDRFESFEVVAIDGSEVTINGSFDETAQVGGAFGTVYTFDRLVLAGTARLRTAASILLVGSDPLETEPETELEARDLILEGTETLSLEAMTLRLRGLADGGGALAALEMEDTDATVTRPLDIGNCVVRSSRLELGAPLVCDTLELESGSTLTVLEPTRGIVYPLDVLVTGLFHVDATSAVDLSGKGYVGEWRGDRSDLRGMTADSEPVAAGDGTGGSHGGEGGVGSEEGTAGPTYDSFAAPRFPGAGGSSASGSDESGGNGGGLLVVDARELQLDGTLRVAGEDSGGGAGAGGSVLLRVETLRGEGLIDACGGNARAASGAGGGGRIAVIYQERAGFTGDVSAFGGTAADASGVAGAGTIYWRRGFRGEGIPAASHGELVIDNGGRLHTGLRTVLRPVGDGTVRAMSGDTLTVSGALVTRDTGHAGHWVVLADRVDAPFLIRENTASSLVLFGDATPAAVARPGDRYRGALFLRRLTVSGGAGVTTGSDVVFLPAGALFVGDESQLDASVAPLEE